LLLNCHTYYSFNYGALSTEELLCEIVSNGYNSFVITDINNTSACIDAVRLAAEYKIKPILGIDFRNGISQKYVAIAKSNDGFKEINEHLSHHLHHNIFFENEAPEFANVYVIYPWQSYTGWALRDNEYIGISLKDVQRLSFLPSNKNYKKLVALQPATFIEKKHFNAHRLLRAIGENLLLSRLPKDLQTTPDEIIYTKPEMYAAYNSYPHIIKNTEEIISNCSIDFEYGKFSNKNLKHYTDSVVNDIAMLREQCIAGINYRFSNPSKEVMLRVEKELQVIGDMQFASYFLINWDIIKFAQHKNYFYVGRGSGANSLVAYLLRITDVDPIELELYFERFINPFRSNPPDFDIDFSWTDRDDMTRYIFERFGNERTALLATYSTFQHDAVTRELGKVFGLPATEIDALQNSHKNSNYKFDDVGKLVLQYSKLIEGFPSHLSIHSSGILISEKPITSYSATFMPPKGYATTQFSMVEAEDIGLYKFDILSQRGLAKIKDTVTLIKQNKNVDIDIHNIEKFKTDVEVKKLLSLGKCIGCFYIESPAMRMLLAKLRADDYLRLVAASSIIRPGVSKSGMMREYILRYRHEHLRVKAQQEIPELYELLKETYGVMVYQEDVIRVGHFFAGLTLAEADYLRRGMSWKFKKRNEFDKVRENFFSNCIKKGYAEKKILDIWNQIESFANYAFSKGHSASYAVESFQALYLKAYYPLEYMVGTLNNGGGFYRTEFYVHEARMHGATIVAPCVNNSTNVCTIQGTTIFLALGMIAELEHTIVKNILVERATNGLFISLYDFTKRVQASVEQLRILIRANVFRFTGKTKKELLWEIHSILNPVNKFLNSNILFDEKPRTYQLPKLEYSEIEDAFDEIELFGFCLNSPFKLLKEPTANNLLANDLKNYLNKTVEILGYLVTTKPTRTANNQRMFFGTFIDMEGNWIDTVHFPPSAAAFPFRGYGCYKLIGKVVIEFDFLSIEVSEMHRLAMLSRED